MQTERRRPVQTIHIPVETEDRVRLAPARDDRSGARLATAGRSQLMSEGTSSCVNAQIRVCVEH